MRLTKLIIVALATAALAVSSATADPGHGKGKPTCKPAPVMLAGTLANDPVTGDTSFQLTAKHANMLGRLYAKAGNPITVNVDANTHYRKAGVASTLDALSQNDRALVFAKVCRADVKKAKQSGSALPELTARLVLDKGPKPDTSSESNTN
jgi:hypothetical protein